MSKKKKKIKDGPKPLIPKKVRRMFARLFIIAVIGLIAYVFYDPAVIGNPDIEKQINDIKSGAFSLNIDGQQQIADFIANKPSLSFLNKYIPQGAVLGEEEVSVEMLLGKAADELKKLPEAQVERIKADFCATPTPSPSP